MTGKISARRILVHMVGALACVAVVTTGWDAEAGWRHRRACCAPACDPCCVPVCAPACGPVCAPACAPVCETVCCRPACSYTVVEREIVLPVSSCCGYANAASPPATETVKDTTSPKVTTASVVKATR